MYIVDWAPSEPADAAWPPAAAAAAAWRTYIQHNQVPPYTDLADLGGQDVLADLRDGQTDLDDLAGLQDDPADHPDGQADLDDLADLPDGLTDLPDGLTDLQGGLADLQGGQGRHRLLDHGDHRHTSGQDAAMTNRI